MKLRAVKLTFKDGLSLIGVVPAGLSDEELAAISGSDIEIEFSDAHEMPTGASLLAVLQRLAAASAMEPIH